MVFIATFWAAFFNLVVLVLALAVHPASIDGLAWLRELPWEWFGTELLGALDMHPVEAGALWALWLCVSGLLLAGSMIVYAVTVISAPPTPVASAVQPQVAAMFSDLSSGMDGLEGFGTAPIPALAPASELPRQPRAAPEMLATTSKPFAAMSIASRNDQDIAATLQHIDPQLSASYDALLRELKK